MNRPSRPTIKRFTMIEILVAMAILLVMMGFLFQFVVSAQRLWLASESRASVFDQAQLALQLLGKDLKSLHFMSENDYPGHSIPMGVQLDGSSNLQKLFMVAPFDDAEVGTYLLMYTVVADELSRYAFNSRITETINDDNGGTESTKTYFPHCFYGFDPLADDNSAASFNDLLDTLESDTDKKGLIATGVESVHLQFFPEDIDSNGFFISLPEAIIITLTLYDARAVARLEDETAITVKKTETRRVFSKIIFLNQAL